MCAEGYSTNLSMENQPVPASIPWLVKVRNLFNTLVLIGSVVVIVALSFEVFYSQPGIDYRIYLKIQLWVCTVFLIDYLLRFYLSPHRWRYLWRNMIFLVVSIPYLNILQNTQIELSHEAAYLVKMMPLIRGGYGLVIMVGWVSRSRLTSLLISYVFIILAMTYFGSLIFYSLEHKINPMVTSYGVALWWAFMNVTTVGSNIYAITPFGQIMSVVLAGSGMMLFPIFTAYITNRFQSRAQAAVRSDDPPSTHTP